MDTDKPAPISPTRDPKYGDAPPGCEWFVDALDDLLADHDARHRASPPSGAA